jgi:hypothetical protein
MAAATLTLTAARCSLAPTTAGHAPFASFLASWLLEKKRKIWVSSWASNSNHSSDRCVPLKRIIIEYASDKNWFQYNAPCFLN